MVKKIFSIFNREFNINQAALLLGFFAIVSQILGLLRDRSLAHFLGPSSSLDIYYASFRIPDFIFISIASLASFTVLIPFMIDKLKSPDSHHDAHKFLSNIFSAFLVVMVLVSIIAYFLMPYLAHFIAPGFSGAMTEKMVVLSRIMLLSPIFLGLSNLFGTVTQIFNKFFIYALSPVLYNAGILFGVIVFYPMWGISGLAAGVALGALLHFSIQLPIIIRQKFLPRFSLNIDFKQIWQVILLSFPRTLGLALNNLSIIGILAMASLISEGSVSIFNFSLNLQTVPLTVIGVSYSVAAFPTLARLFSRNETSLFIDKIISAARQMIFWSLPITFLFVVLRAQIVRTILGTGRFSWSDTKLTAAALALFTISLLAQGLILLLVRGYYAAGRTKRPLAVNLFFAVFTVVLAYGLIQLFNNSAIVQYFFETIMRVENIKGSVIMMLPLAYSIGTILNLIVLWLLFKKDFLDAQVSYLTKPFFEALGSSFIIGIVAYKFLTIFAKVFDLETFWGIFLQGLFAGLLGIIAGAIILKLIKNEEFDSLIKAFKTKFWQTKVIAPSQDVLN
jgi:putative peptidoglycan lipid II flippase